MKRDRNKWCKLGEERKLLEKEVEMKMKKQKKFIIKFIFWDYIVKDNQNVFISLEIRRTTNIKWENEERIKGK